MEKEFEKRMISVIAKTLHEGSFYAEPDDADFDVAQHAYGMSYLEKNGMNQYSVTEKGKVYLKQRAVRKLQKRAKIEAIDGILNHANQNTFIKLAENSDPQTRNLYTLLCDEGLLRQSGPRSYRLTALGMRVRGNGYRWYTRKMFYEHTCNWIGKIVEKISPAWR